jgi:hypothetical protein
LFYRAGFGVRQNCELLDLVFDEEHPELQKQLKYGVFSLLLPSANYPTVESITINLLFSAQIRRPNDSTSPKRD